MYNDFDDRIHNADDQDTVQSLIDGYESMPQEEFEEKWSTLSDDDMNLMSDYVDYMGDKLMNEGWDDDDNDDDDDDGFGNPEGGEAISIDDAVDIWLSNGKDEDYTCGYDEWVLEDYLNSRG